MLYKLPVLAPAPAKRSMCSRTHIRSRAGGACYAHETTHRAARAREPTQRERPG
jgi:hypothetical protein